MRPTSDDLCWAAKRLKNCVRLRANLSSIKVDESHCKSTHVVAKPSRKLPQVFNLRKLATPFGQGLYCEVCKGCNLNPIQPSENSEFHTRTSKGFNKASLFHLSFPEEKGVVFYILALAVFELNAIRKRNRKLGNFHSLVSAN